MNENVDLIKLIESTIDRKLKEKLTGIRLVLATEREYDGYTLTVSVKDKKQNVLLRDKVWISENMVHGHVYSNESNYDED